MLQRFTREKRRAKDTLFDLELADEEALTHSGRPLDLGDRPLVDDDADEAQRLEYNVGSDANAIPLKRKRGLLENQDLAEPSNQPEQKRSRNEIMKDVIVNSKIMKHERQQEKEENDDLRAELDKELSSVIAAWNATRPVQEAKLSEAADSKMPLKGTNGIATKTNNNTATDKAYDAQIRELVLDKRAKPTDRSKTEAEKTAEEASRLKSLEENRLRRMRGEVLTDEEDDNNQEEEQEEDYADDANGLNEAADFGFTDGQVQSGRLNVEDEDDFEIDHDLVDGDYNPKLEMSGDDSSISEDEESESDEAISDADETMKPSDRPSKIQIQDKSRYAGISTIPTSHEEFIKILQNYKFEQTNWVIQSIRALYPEFNGPDKKEMFAQFATILIEHIVYLSSNQPTSVLEIIGAVIRHVHSMARTFPEDVAEAFRTHLRRMHKSKKLEAGDLIILTAIGSIYPTSDHFHQVVTPAMTIMASWLELNYPTTEQNLHKGAYIGNLCLEYQSLAKRYIPELLRFTLLALDSKPTSEFTRTYADMLVRMAEMWVGKAAFPEIFGADVLQTLTDLKMDEEVSKLRKYLNSARLARRPLELHHHRPLAIKSSIPKFEESYNPYKHYDPDRERADQKKLLADYKRERKGALRELRKDANFIAREKLRQKKEADSAYETKYRRLIAEIQGEEGKEKNAYEREKRSRKSRK